MKGAAIGRAFRSFFLEKGTEKTPEGALRRKLWGRSPHSPANFRESLIKAFGYARSAFQSVRPLSAQPVFARLRKPVPRSLSRIRRQRRRVVADDSLPGDTGAESPREQPSRVSALRRQASRLPNAEHRVLSKQIARRFCRRQPSRRALRAAASISEANRRKAAALRP